MATSVGEGADVAAGVGDAAGTAVGTAVGAVVGAGMAGAVSAAVGAGVYSRVGWLEEADADVCIGVGAGLASLTPNAASTILPAARTVRQTFTIRI